MSGQKIPQKEGMAGRSPHGGRSGQRRGKKREVNDSNERRRHL